MKAKKQLNKKPKYKSLNISNWGIDFKKDEYKEIVLSNSNHPELIENFPKSCWKYS